jgi:hypothetical protein
MRRARSVLAHNSYGWSSPSGASDIAFTLSLPPAAAAEATVPPAAVPAVVIPAPVLGAVLDADVRPDAVTLRWQPVAPSVFGIDSYAVQYRAIDGDPFWTTVRGPLSSSSSCVCVCACACACL